MTKTEKQLLVELIEQATKYRELAKGDSGYYKGVQDGLEFAIDLMADTFEQKHLETVSKLRATRRNKYAK